MYLLPSPFRRISPRLVRRLVLLSAILALTLVSAPSQADAQCFGGGLGGFGFGGYGFFPGNGYGRNLYSIGNVPIPPYFALHPPVYYGERVRRSYGVSPFAYPPYPSLLSQPTSRSAARSTASPSPPKLVVNPFMESHDTGATGLQLTTSDQTRPEWIHNPFYDRESLDRQLTGIAD